MSSHTQCSTRLQGREALSPRVQARVCTSSTRNDRHNTLPRQEHAQHPDVSGILETRGPTSLLRVTGFRQGVLLLLLLVVTLGMVESLRTLSSDRETTGIELMRTLFSLTRYVSVGILLVGSVIVFIGAVLAFLLTMRRECADRVHTASRSHANFAPATTSYAQFPHVTDVLAFQRKRTRQQQVVLEQDLVRICATVLCLSLEQVHGNSDFFQLGGDAESLQSFLFLIERHCYLRLTPDHVFDHSVLFRLAAFTNEHTTFTKVQ